ncbi:MAG TPA: cation:proton antiporter [Pyrinomonadaceae bacterium]|nr:cation:proton antiporter [Pyrinomonadaceae bacterium]
MPNDFPLLGDLLLLLLVSVPITFLFSRLRLPTIVGFMITGVLIGPYGFGLIKDVHAIEVLAEIGVVLLLFTIGLEFSLRRIAEMRRIVLVGGGLQVTLTTLLVAVIAYWFGRPLNQSVFFGFLFALSSTAIVLKSYIERAEVDAPHGRAGVGILLFQDLSIVLMMLMVPVLGGREGSSPGRIALTLGTALAAIAIIIFAARKVVPFLLYHIVRLRSPEVFIIFVVLMSLGTAWLTSQFGLSLALGAFIAGMVLSESEYSHQIVADILPFRDVFNSLFFVSIGMLLSLSALFSDLAVVLAWIGALTLGKALVVFAAVRLLGHSLRISTMTAIGLAQIGEFSFILAKAGLPEGLLSDVDYQRFLAASILSMIATPFLIKAAPRVGYALQTLFAPGSMFEPTVTGFRPDEPDLRGHVVIVGYGLNGRNLAKVLRRAKVPYLVLELNAEVVREAAAQDERIIYGDATRKEVIYHVGLEHARILVLAISDPTATRHTVWLARQVTPDIHIIVRTRYMSELAELRELGADEVIPEEFETSIEIFSRVLREYGIARHAIQRHVSEIRSEGYQMLRSPSVPLVSMSEIAEALGTAATETLQLEEGSPAVGRTIGELELRRRTGATVVAVVRDGLTDVNPGSEFRFEVGDIIVLLGAPEQIDRAIEQINASRENNVARDGERIETSQ